MSAIVRHGNSGCQYAIREVNREDSWLQSGMRIPFRLILRKDFPFRVIADVSDIHIAAQIEHFRSELRHDDCCDDGNGSGDESMMRFSCGSNTSVRAEQSRESRNLGVSKKFTSTKFLVIFISVPCITIATFVFGFEMNGSCMQRQ